MTSVVAILSALAAFGLCAMHVVMAIIDHDRDKTKRSDIETVKKELEDEILNGGNIARITQLRKRLCELEQ